MKYTSSTKLLRAITVVNNRYAKGLNDDDQVGRMCEIDKQTKGFSFIPKFDTYELITDYDKFKYYADKFGYWSEQVKAFNTILTQKGNYPYMEEINNKYKEEQRKY